MLRACLAAMAPLLCGCSLMLPPGFGSDTDTTDGADTTGEVPADVVDGDGTESCEPAVTRCDGDRYEQCEGDGTGWTLVSDCTTSGQICLEGTGCVADTACSRAAAGHHHYGCEFWIAPLPIDTLIDATQFELGLVITNVGTETAHFVITDGEATVREDDLPTTSSWHVGLPLKEAQSHGMPSGTWNTLLVPSGAYYLTSDNPVAVWQMNPRHFKEGGDYSMHASVTMLLPEHSLRTSYRVLGVPPLSTYDVATAAYVKRAAYISIVGTSDTTTLEIRAGGTIAAGSGIAETTDGDVIHTTIGAGEVLHLASAVPPDCTSSHPTFHDDGELHSCTDEELDLSGTSIEASQPVAVFSGAVGANVPYDTGTPDHVEEQLPPAETFGTTFVTAPMTASGETDVHGVVKLLAVQDATTVTVDPPQSGTSTEVLHDGDTLEFVLTGPAVITATKPVLAAQLMVGRDYGPTTRPIGDPAMTWLVPAEQWTDTYAFEVSPEFASATDGSEVYILVAAAPGTSVEYDMDTVPAGDWVSVGGSGDFRIAWIYVDEGIHFIESDAPAGVHVWGLGPAVGIACPVGTLLDRP